MKAEELKAGEVRLMSVEALANMRVDYADAGGYQRRRTQQEITRIRTEHGPLREHAWVPHIIAGLRSDDAYYCVDGNGRRLCAIEEGSALYACIIPGITNREQEREVFCWLNGMSAAVTPVQLIQAHGGPVATAVRNMSATTCAHAISWQKTGGIHYHKEGESNNNGRLKADLAAYVIVTGATGQVIRLRQILSDHTLLRDKRSLVAGCNALLNVVEVFANRSIYREPALVLAGASYERSGRRFTREEIQLLRRLPWEKQKTHGEMRHNWNREKLRSMVERALGK